MALLETIRMKIDDIDQEMKIGRFPILIDRAGLCSHFRSEIHKNSGLFLVIAEVARLARQARPRTGIQRYEGADDADGSPPNSYESGYRNRDLPCRSIRIIR